MANDAKQLPTSAWDWLYQYALRETDRGRLLAITHEAIQLMVRRLHELGPENVSERQRLVVCIGDLRVLQSGASRSGA
ncbi:MAG TPA: hypothetical protein VFB23_08615 [Candidatus Acidoferrales bacterium]|jgi:hypothetical protein|nr:hypothetical protein [Candidatus Acidoferrales bacterium]